MARARPQPNRVRLGLEAARSFARQPGAIAHAMWPVRRSRPRYRILLNAVATAEGAWLARVAREWRADHIHAHWAHWTSTVAMAASTVSGIPWSFTAHRYDVVANNLLDEKLRSARFGRFIARHMLEMARGMVSPEAASRAIVLHMGVRLPQELVAPPPRATPVVVCPGRLVPMKGQRHLVDAAALLAARGVTFELWLAGDGPERAALAKQIREHGLHERVKTAWRGPARFPARALSHGRRGLPGAAQRRHGWRRPRRAQRGGHRGDGARHSGRVDRDRRPIGAARRRRL